MAPAILFALMNFLALFSPPVVPRPYPEANSEPVWEDVLEAPTEEKGPGADAVGCPPKLKGSPASDAPV